MFPWYYIGMSVTGSNIILMRMNFFPIGTYPAVWYWRKICPCIVLCCLKGEKLGISRKGIERFQGMVMTEFMHVCL